MGSDQWVAHCRPLSNSCGMSLRNGTMWIGELCFVTAVGMIILGAVGLSTLHSQGYPDGLLKGLHALPLVLGFAQLATSALLVAGVLCERPVFLLPWLVFFSVQTGLILLTTIGGSIALAALVIPMGLGMSLFLPGIAYFYTFRYFILVVYSYYRQLMVTPEGSSAVGVVLLQ